MEMLLEELTSESHTGPSVHYMGVFLEDDSSMARTQESNVAGKLMAKWWDSCPAAGNQRRPRSGFSEPLPSLEVLSVADSMRKNLRLSSIVSEV